MPFLTDLTNFDRSTSRFLTGLRDGSETVLRDHAGDAAVEMAMATPPGANGVSGDAARRRGEISLTASALQVVAPITGARKAPTVAAVIARHRRGGRTVRPSRRIVVSRADFDSYLADALPKVGYTAGGFATAAQALGKSLPGWMTDRNAPGSFRFEVGSDRVIIEFANRVPWLSSMSGVPARLEAIMRDREPLLIGQLKAMAFQQAKAAGF